MRLFIALCFVLSTAFAQDGYIQDYNYQLTDIASKNLRKEKLFEKMTREMDLEHSICANRAHVWAYDFFRFNKINVGKIFIFFGSSLWKKKETGYMYHVAPYLLENGTEYVMEASYSDLTKPLTVGEWIENETSGKVKGHECLDITAKDKDLTEYFYERYNLPEKRDNGMTGAKCYIKKVPGYYVFPASIAYHELKKDDDGKPVSFNPKTYDVDEVFEACVEVVTSKVGRFFGGGKSKCKKYLKL